MDKDHLIELISSNLIYEIKNTESIIRSLEFKKYLKKLNIDQLRTISNEFIL